MSVEKSLVAAGAKCVAGDLILKNQVVGHYRNGDFHASLEGLAVFQDMQKKLAEEIVVVARESIASEDIDVGEVHGLESETTRRRRGGRNAE